MAHFIVWFEVILFLYLVLLASGVAALGGFCSGGRAGGGRNVLALPGRLTAFLDTYPRDDPTRPFPSLTMTTQKCPQKLQTTSGGESNPNKNVTFKSNSILTPKGTAKPFLESGPRFPAMTPRRCSRLLRHLH